MSESLVLVVSLYFEEGTSDKEYHVALYDKHVSVRYGRRFSVNQTAGETFETAEKAAAKFWGLLRQKTGKGYRVETARAFALSSDERAQQLLFPNPEVRFTTRNRLDDLLATWLRGSFRVASSSSRRLNEQPRSWEATPTPRTSRQGQAIISALADSNCTEDLLLSCVMAPVEERFLWVLANSHPNCPDEAHVADALFL